MINTFISNKIIQILNIDFIDGWDMQYYEYILILQMKI